MYQRCEFIWKVNVEGREIYIEKKNKTYPWIMVSVLSNYYGWSTEGSKFLFTVPQKRKENIDL